MEFDYTFSYPPTINNPELVRTVESSVKHVLGKDRFMSIARPAATGEDFSYFAREVPAVYMWLGCKKEGEDNYPLHNSRFNFAEEILTSGVMALAGIALNGAGME